MTSTSATAPPRVGSPRRLTFGEVEAAAKLLARAFASEPTAVLLAPDPAYRHWLNEHTARRAIRTALAHATAVAVDVDGSLAGVAVWRAPSDEPALLAARLASSAEVLWALPRFTRIVPRMGAMVLREHATMARLLVARRRAVRAAARGCAWQLVYLGTSVEHLRQGIARSLLEHVLRRCDADGLPVWLETTDPNNVPMYERFGFETVAAIDGGGVLPSWWVLRRKAS